MTAQSGDGASRAAILAALAQEPTLSRTELAHRLGIGAATISSQVKRLIGLDFIRELPAPSSSGGRPRVPLELVRDRAFVVGVGIAVDHIVVVAVGTNGTVLADAHDEFDPAHSAARTIATSVRAIIRTVNNGTCMAVGISLSGVVDAKHNSVVVSVVLGWHNRGLGAELAEQLGIPVYLENDVLALATRELAFSNPAPDDFLLLAIGTGIGMAIVTDHSIFRGAGHSSTEFGHVSIDAEGRPCRCGNIGCLETYAGLAELIAAAPWGVTEERSLAGLHEALRAGDEPMLDYLRDIGTILGRAAGGAATLLGIGTLRVTGATTELWPYLEDSFNVSLAGNTSTLSSPVTYTVSNWSEIAGAAGAAGLAFAKSLDGLH